MHPLHPGDGARGLHESPVKLGLFLARYQAANESGSHDGWRDEDELGLRLDIWRFYITERSDDQ